MEILSSPKHDYLEEKMEEKDTELGGGGGREREEEKKKEKENRVFTAE